MAGTVHLPGVGPVSKTYVFAGVGITAGILIWAYYKHSKTAKAAAPVPTDTTGTATGTDYTQAGTLSDYGQGYGYGQPFSRFGYDLYGNPTPAPTGAGSAGVTTSNTAWVAAAEADLQNAGYDIATVGAALSKVLAGIGVTPEQRDIFLQAVGVEGNPPQGYPQPIKVTTSGPPPPPTPPPAAVPSNIPNARFVRYVNVSWNDVARGEGVFGANGAALYAYNGLPGKHQPGDYSDLPGNYPHIGARPRFQVAIPVTGKQINLPGIGVVTS